MNSHRKTILFILLWIVTVLGIGMFALVRSAQGATEPVEQISIPSSSYLYRFKLEREVSAVFGQSDATSRIAGQVHKESLWRADARSAYAEGMAQFTPATAAWLVTICPEIGPTDPWDPNWSVRAVVCYDHWIYGQVTGASECDRWAFTLSSYNGGLGWLLRDRTLASSKGFDSARWFGNVEMTTSRASWARLQNRDYVERILRVFEPVYIAAGWPGQAVCQ